MLNYLRGFQCRLSDLGFPTNLISGLIFNNPVEGLKSALDNKFSWQKSRGGITKSINVLAIQDIHTIFDSEYMSPSNSTDYRNRLNFEVVLAIGTRPTELWLFEVS